MNCLLSTKLKLGRKANVNNGSIDICGVSDNARKITEIIVVVCALSGGGTERAITNLLTQWNKDGIAICIVQLEPADPDNMYPIPDSVEVINIPNKKGLLLNKRIYWAHELAKIMHKKPHAAVVAFMYRAMLAVTMASFSCNNLIVFSERMDPSRITFYSMMSKRLFRFADKCIFQTKEAMSYFPKYIQNKGVVIPNAIAPGLPERYVGQKEKTIIAACRLEPQKNVKMMIKACASVFADYPNYKLIIYGEGSKRSTLEKLIKDLGMENNIFLPGYCNRIHDKMKSCCCYLSSSNYEGISNSMLEAMALGIPSIVTDCPIGGARLVIKNNVNGILVRVGDIDAMRTAIVKVISDSTFAQNLSDMAYQIRKQYPLDKIAKQWITHMECS